MSLHFNTEHPDCLRDIVDDATAALEVRNSIQPMRAETIAMQRLWAGPKLCDFILHRHRESKWQAK